MTVEEGAAAMTQALIAIGLAMFAWQWLYGAIRAARDAGTAS